MTTRAIPYVLREMCFEIEQHFDLHLGVPMNAKLPKAEGEAKAQVHFPGNNFKLDVETGTGHFGLWLSVRRIQACMTFHSREAAEKWISNLQRFSGPLSWSFDEDKLRFVVEGVALDRLAMNASNRRNDLPTYEWDAVDHPFKRSA